MTMFLLLVAGLLALGCPACAGNNTQCEVARAKCAHRPNCYKSLHHYMVGCNDVLLGRTLKCPYSCQRALIALTSSEEGLELDNCDCGDNEYCRNSKARVEVCRPEVSHATADSTVVSCGVARVICAADPLCSTALDFYHRFCRPLFHGRKCTPRCNNSLAILDRQEKASKLRTCFCDGSEDFQCTAIKRNTQQLCYGNEDWVNYVPTTTTLKPAEDTAGAGEVRPSLWLVAIAVFAALMSSGGGRTKMKMQEGIRCRRTTILGYSRTGCCQRTSNDCQRSSDGCQRSSDGCQRTSNECHHSRDEEMEILDDKDSSGKAKVECEVRTSCDRRTSCKYPRNSNEYNGGSECKDRCSRTNSACSESFEPYKVIMVDDDTRGRLSKQYSRSITDIDDVEEVFEGKYIYRRTHRPSKRSIVPIEGVQSSKNISESVLDERQWSSDVSLSQTKLFCHFSRDCSTDLMIEPEAQNNNGPGAIAASSQRLESRHWPWWWTSEF